MRPDFTLQNQKSTLPLPRPIRTSFGLDVCVESGYARIHLLPLRLSRLVSVRRTASICCAVRQPCSIA
jgi:hypothetical protein